MLIKWARRKARSEVILGDLWRIKIDSAATYSHFLASSFLFAVSEAHPTDLVSIGIMEASQDKNTPVIGKKRGRRSKSEIQAQMEQEMTVSDTERLSMEVKTTRKGRKPNNKEDKVPESVIQQAVKWEDAGKIEANSEQSQQDQSQSDSSSFSFEEVVGHKTKPYLAEAVPSTSYEWLGMRTVEPSSREPILKLTRENSKRVAWAGKDCLSSGEASFFDRLETMRRVALAEVAKASNGMEAIAVLGIVFDRGMLLLAAEEVFGVTRGRTIVQETAPGNYDELACRIGAERKPKRFTKKRDPFTRVEGAKQVKSQSKGALRYHTSLGAPERRNLQPLNERGGDACIGSMSRRWEAWKAKGLPDSYANGSGME